MVYFFQNASKDIITALGMPARTLYLKTKNVETRSSDAGHVVMEVFIEDLDKWVMIDPQFDAIPYSDGVPLNAVEFQRAITEIKDIDVKSSDPKFSMDEYISWIYPYLYYLDISFDNRENIDFKNRLCVDSKSRLMLVPIGAKEPTVFQKLYKIDYCLYTSSLKNFYRRP